MGVEVERTGTEGSLGAGGVDPGSKNIPPLSLLGLLFPSPHKVCAPLAQLHHRQWWGVGLGSQLY